MHTDTHTLTHAHSLMHTDLFTFTHVAFVLLDEINSVINRYFYLVSQNANRILDFNRVLLAFEFFSF